VHYIVPEPEGLVGGKLNPMFMSQVDRDGVSVLREAAANQEFSLTLDELSARWAAKRHFHGVYTFDVRSARSDADGRRLTCVYDTSLPGKRHHADIMGPTIQAPSTNNRRLQEKRRIKAFVENVSGSFTPAAQFRAGQFERYARSGTSR
jgi:hypothetical protein